MSNVYTRKNLLPRSLTQADYNRNNGTSNFAYKQLPEIKKEDESKLINEKRYKKYTPWPGGITKQTLKKLADFEYSCKSNFTCDLGHGQNEGKIYGKHYEYMKKKVMPPDDTVPGRRRLPPDYYTSTTSRDGYSWPRKVDSKYSRVCRLNKYLDHGYINGRMAKNNNFGILPDVTYHAFPENRPTLRPDPYQSVQSVQVLDIDPCPRISVQSKK